MQVIAVTGGILNRMAEGVAEIEQGPAALSRSLAFVRLDDPRLDGTAAADHVRKIGARGLQRNALQPSEERSITKQAVLDYLGGTGGEFPFGQGPQHFG